MSVEYTDLTAEQIALNWIHGNREDAIASLEALAPAGVALFFYMAEEYGLDRREQLRIVNRLQDRLYERNSDAYQ